MFAAIALICNLIVVDVYSCLRVYCAFGFCGFSVGNSCVWFALLVSVNLGVSLLFCCLCLLLVKRLFVLVLYCL